MIVEELIKGAAEIVAVESCKVKEVWSGEMEKGVEG